MSVTGIATVLCGKHVVNKQPPSRGQVVAVWNKKINTQTNRNLQTLEQDEAPTIKRDCDFICRASFAFFFGQVLPIGLYLFVLEDLRDGMEMNSVMGGEVKVQDIRKTYVYKSDYNKLMM